MTDDPVKVLETATKKLVELTGMMEEIEAGRQFLAERINTLLDLISKLEVERNGWRSKAEELERELRVARRRCADLGMRTGELRCPNCGSASIVILHGVIGEDYCEYALDCQECGHREEVA